MIKITKEQIDPNQMPKKVGFKGRKPVLEFMTKGGLNCISLDGKLIGSGPHRGLARHIAQIQEPELVFDELTKSESFDLNVYKHLVPVWTEITNRIREALNA